jgi:hypothetical protein
MDKVENVISDCTDELFSIKGQQIENSLRPRKKQTRHHQWSQSIVNFTNFLREALPPIFA